MAQQARPNDKGHSEL